MSTSPRGPAQNYNLDDLAFPRVILATLAMPMLSSEVRTWGELREYARANSWNLPADTYEQVQALQIQYTEAGPAVPLVPPDHTAANRAPATQARGRSSRGSVRARGGAERRRKFGARGGGSSRSTTPSEPTPVAQQSAGLSQVALPSRHVPSVSHVYEHSSSVLQEPGHSRALQASAPSRQPSRASGLNRASPPRKGNVVLTVIPGSPSKSGPTVLRSYTKAPVVGPTAMVRTAPRAQPAPGTSKDDVDSPKGNIENSPGIQETKTKSTVSGTHDSNTSSTIIDSEIPTNISDALSVFPSLMPRPAV